VNRKARRSWIWVFPPWSLLGFGNNFSWGQVLGIFQNGSFSPLPSRSSREVWSVVHESDRVPKGKTHKAPAPLTWASLTFLNSKTYSNGASNNLPVVVYVFLSWCWFFFWGQGSGVGVWTQGFTLAMLAWQAGTVPLEPLYQPIGTGSEEASAPGHLFPKVVIPCICLVSL
jgi:hypothetical protein